MFCVLLYYNFLVLSSVSSLSYKDEATANQALPVPQVLQATD